MLTTYKPMPHLFVISLDAVGIALTMPTPEGRPSDNNVTAAAGGCGLSTPAAMAPPRGCCQRCERWGWTRRHR